MDNDNVLRVWVETTRYTAREMLENFPKSTGPTDYDLIEETIVSTGELTTTKPGTYHRFEALEDTVAFELYWAEFDSNDIVRENHGGVLEE